MRCSLLSEGFSELEMRPNQIVTHNTELENAMNEVLSAKWEELRGLQGGQCGTWFCDIAG